MCLHRHRHTGCCFHCAEFAAKKSRDTAGLPCCWQSKACQRVAKFSASCGAAQSWATSDRTIRISYLGCDYGCGLPMATTRHCQSCRCVTAAHPKTGNQSTALGGLSLGESSYLVDRICENTVPPEELIFLTPSDSGFQVRQFGSTMLKTRTCGGVLICKRCRYRRALRRAGSILVNYERICKRYFGITYDASRRGRSRRVSRHAIRDREPRGMRPKAAADRPHAADSAARLAFVRRRRLVIPRLPKPALTGGSKSA